MRTEKEIEREILNRVEEIYRLKKKQKRFIAGKTRIDYASRVYN